MNSRFAFFFFMIWNSGILFGQNSLLIDYLSESQVQLSAECQSRLADWDSIPQNEDIFLVSINDVALVQQSGRIAFTLPGVTDTLYANTTLTRNSPDSSEIWHGVLDCHEGYALLASKNGITSGYINYLDNTYSIRKLCDGQSVLITHHNADLVAECGNQDTTSALVGPSKTNTTRSQDPNEVDPQICCESTVLVLYTSSAESTGDPITESVVLVENMNQALVNSQVCHAVRHVGTEKINWVENKYGFQSDLQAIISVPEVNVLRDQYSADMVIVLVGQNYILGFQEIYGVAWLSELNEQHAYALVSLASPPGRHIFAHEWAHNLGARHAGDPTPGFAHAHLLSNTATIVTNEEDENILHYSNPDIDFNGESTGVVNTNDNARQIDTLGCAIAQYRGSNDPCDELNAFIDGPRYVQPGITYSWCAVGECPNTATYSWEYSFDGFGWYSGGSNSCFSFTVGQESILVRLTISCQNGCSSEANMFSLNTNGFIGEDCIGALMGRERQNRI